MKVYRRNPFTGEYQPIKADWIDWSAREKPVVFLMIETDDPNQMLVAIPVQSIIREDSLVKKE